MKHPQVCLSRRSRIILLLACSWLFAVLALFTFPPGRTLAVTASSIDTTLGDFNRGTFFRTGLTRDPAGGGDGDGEVRLLTIGISAKTWRSDGNTTGLPALQGHAAAQKNGYIYVAGGQSGAFSPYTHTVSYSAINPSTHNLANWSQTSSLPEARYAPAIVNVGNYLYAIGGLAQNYVATNSVYVAIINPNGTLGPWSATAPIPVALSDMASVVVSGTIYVLGGADTEGNTQDKVYYAKPNASTGAITSWATTVANLPKVTKQQTAASFNGAIYEIGGAGDLSYPDVYDTFPDSAGNIPVWNSTVNMPTNLVLGSAVAFGAQLYVAGGAFNAGADSTKTIASNLINKDGTLLAGGWTNSDVLSTKRKRSAAVLSDDGWVYVIEGNPAEGLDPLHTIDFGPTAAAGAIKYSTSGEFTSNPWDLGGSYPIRSLRWNASVTNTAKISLTVQYRAGNVSDLSGIAWKNAGDSAMGTLITNTVPVTETARYFQYRAIMTSRQDDLTPALNAVEIEYERPGQSDLVVTRIGIGAQSGPSRSLNVTVLNQGTSPARPAFRVARSPGTSLPRVAPRQANPAAPNDTYYFFVDLYIDRVVPVDPSDLGNCTLNGIPNYGSAQTPLGPGQSVDVPVQCDLVAGTRHSIAAMVDTFPYTSECDPGYGCIWELDETNNTFLVQMDGRVYFPFLSTP